MRLSNPNQYEETRRQEGFTNPEDIWDLETFDEIKKSIEQLPVSTRELIFEEDLTEEMKICLEKIRTFCSELSEDFKQTFLALLEQYRQERLPISQKIVDFMMAKDLVLPSFIIASQEQAQALLQAYNLHKVIDAQKLLLVFQLPSPLAHFWWKGGAGSWGNRAVDVQDQAIEWGHFYRELMPVVWENQGRHENEGGLVFRRVNEVGEHDPQKYYYIWEMSSDLTDWSTPVD